MDPKFLIRPRPKKSILPPPTKKRKQDHALQTIDFDSSKREEYLTGFHKRKLQRVKLAQAEALKRAKEDKLEERRQLRQERKKELEEHVQSINAMLKDVKGQETEEESHEWSGVEEDRDVVPELVINHEDEYMDDDRYTTVTVEAVDVDKEGLKAVVQDAEHVDDGADVQVSQMDEKESKSKKRWPKKTRKKKFRYETKAERKVTRAKQKAGKKSSAEARKGGK